MEPLVFYIAAALLFSAFIKGSLGLGFSTICLPLLANVVDLKSAIAIVLLPSLFSNLLLMYDAGEFKKSFSLFYQLLLLTIPGMFIGLTILKQADNNISLLILAVILISYGLWNLYSRPLTISLNSGAKLNPIIGLFTGIINGATGSQIFPILPYLLALPISRNTMIQTINLSFTLGSLIMLASLWQINVVTLEKLGQYSLGIIPVIIGVSLGNRLRSKLSDERYRKAVMILIIVLGSLLLYRNTLA